MKITLSRKSRVRFPLNILHKVSSSRWIMTAKEKSLRKLRARDTVVFGTDCDQDRITWGNPQKWCSDSLPLLNGPLRRTRSLCYQAQTPVWSKSIVDEHNLYFARSAIIGYLAVETWRVKTELIIITTSILNLGFKTFAPKILAHTTCINRYCVPRRLFIPALQ
jgi:hypothetical protein